MNNRNIMKVILIKKVEGLGNIGELKDVKPGFARNFLLARKFAVLPSDAQAKEISENFSSLKGKQKTKKITLEKVTEKIADKKFIFSSKAQGNGKLYGSIGPKEISRSIGLPEKYITARIKKLGLHNIDLDIDGKKIKIQIEIIKEK